jgi:MFS family permease
MPFSQTLRRAFRREILTICGIIFLADCIWSLQAPTFSIYAASLGASLSWVGFLSSLAGLTQFVISMWLGIQSDLRGRKIILVLGFVEFALSMLMLAIASQPWMLIPSRILFGLASVSTFTIGIAYLGDIVSSAERGIAFGMYTTSMGIGATLGPLLGSTLQANFGITGSYWSGVLLALGGALLALVGLIDTRKLRPEGTPQHAGPALGTMLSLLRNPNLLAACVSTFVTNASFTGLILGFFPLRMTALGASQSTVSQLFSARAFGSTLARFPSGVLSARISRWVFLLISLGVIAFAALSMSQLTDISTMAILLILEGIAFGMFLTVGQSFVSEHSTPSTRGAAIGLYSTAGSLSSTFSPLLFGVIADAFGMQSVFVVTGVISASGLLLLMALYARARAANTQNPIHPKNI